MNHITKREKGIAGILALTLALSVGVKVSADHTEQTNNVQSAEQETTEDVALTAGAISEIQMSHATGLCAGALTDIYEYSTIASVSENEKDIVASKLLLDEDFEEGTIYGYKNLGFSEVEGNLNVREEASTSSSVVGKLTNHNAVEIISTSKDGKWYEITSGNVEGYVSTDYILTGDDALALVDDLIATYATVNVKTLNVRSEANTDSNIVTKVNDAEDLLVTSISDDWIEVAIDDYTAFVAADYVTLSNKFPTGKTIKELHYGSDVSDTRVALCEYALQFVGNPYVWGGSSLTNGTDCSGFTMRVFAQFGISLPHYSGSQPSYGTRINAEDAQPGDLFFYGSGHISHVAIYIGNGQIVHAASSREGIKISSAYYQTPICVVSYF
ncbi:MAG: peptidoglycan endopeptidase [Lachnospiraceae bacterium]|nr:peptidoglycan endopeptidase [Lachnospiraceae bacterium]